MDLFISDLDGTLLNSDGQVSEFSTNNLNKLIAGGLNFSIATARTPATVVPLLKNLNLPLPVVIMNGVAIYDLKEEKYIKYNSIEKNSSIKIYNLLKKYKVNFFTYTLKNNHIYVYFENTPTEKQQIFMDNRKGSPLKTFIQGQVPLDDTILYFFIMDEKPKIIPIYNEIKNLEHINSFAYADIYEANAFLLEIFSDASSKANGIKYIMDKYHFDNLTVFGDNFNDVPMFELANNKIAVSNAVEPLKDISTQIIDSNDNDGVVNYLNDLTY